MHRIAGERSSAWRLEFDVGGRAPTARIRRTLICCVRLVKRGMQIRNCASEQYSRAATAL
jgi:hypothetical protein